MPWSIQASRARLAESRAPEHPRRYRRGEDTTCATRAFPTRGVRGRSQSGAKALARVYGEGLRRGAAGLAVGCLLLACDLGPRSARGDAERGPLSETSRRADAAERSGVAAETPSPSARLDSGSGAEPELRTFRRKLMGTYFRIVVPEPASAETEAAVEAAFDVMARIETRLSEWIPDSEISQINRGSGSGKWFEVHPDTLANLRLGTRISELSAGAFDLTWAALRGLYTFDDTRNEAPSPEAIAKRLPRIDYRALEVDVAGSRARLTRPDMVIGTGGITKGYALDEAGRLLRERGVRDFMLDAGGQVHLSGLRGGRSWRFAVRHPRKAEPLALIEASDVAVATSGDYEHYFMDSEGRRWHHIIDPRTGYPARASASVTVLSENGMAADALATTLFIVGPEAGQALLNQLDYAVEAVWITANGHIIETRGLHGKVAYRDADVASDPLRIKGMTP